MISATNEGGAALIIGDWVKLSSELNALLSPSKSFIPDQIVQVKNICKDYCGCEIATVELVWARSNTDDYFSYFVYSMSIDSVLFHRVENVNKLYLRALRSNRLSTRNPFYTGELWSG